MLTAIVGLRLLGRWVSIWYNLRVHLEIAMTTKKQPMAKVAFRARRTRASGQFVKVPTAEEIRKGISFAYIETLQANLAASEQAIRDVVKMSRTTLNRRKESGRLTHEESDRTATLLRVYDKAVAYFEGDADAATRWLKHPAGAFGGETPLQHSDTATGAQEVIELLSRLEHGIPT
jgi:putative toxin-antitoxin system antitoxin component (TIGR02293 family)